MKQVKCLKDPDEAGFTLVEILLTMLIISSLTILILPALYKTKESLHIQTFLTQLESDVRYVQMNKYNHWEDSFLYFGNGEYIVQGKKDQRYEKREYPKGLQVYASDRTIQFSKKGTIKKPQTVTLQFENERYQLIFPFGKGRFYVQKL